MIWPWDENVLVGRPWDGNVRLIRPWDENVLVGRPWDGNVRLIRPWDENVLVGRPWDGNVRLIRPWDENVLVEEGDGVGLLVLTTVRARPQLLPASFPHHPRYPLLADHHMPPPSSQSVGFLLGHLDCGPWSGERSDSTGTEHRA